jgi:3-hydroxyacyl-CoA dehydrogenase
MGGYTYRTEVTITEYSCHDGGYEMKQIKTAAVLGSGVMGAAIAAHLANARIRVVLIDITPQELTEAEKAAGASLADKRVRNRIVTAGYEGLNKMKPNPLYLPGNASYIVTGNFDDDMARLRDCDWVIEAVVEEMAIKKRLLTEKVVPNLKEGAILSTNTSGLSVNEMADVLPEKLRRNFLGTHFFNPPRYMRLLELVPSRHTDPEIVSFMAEFIGRRLGKGIVYGKDTPNFIANRIGVYTMFNTLRHMSEMGLTVEEVDEVAGPVMARPKSAVFRLSDLIGNDTLIRVGNNSYRLLEDDDEREIFQVPGFVTSMVERGLLGNKTKQGFYKKVKAAGREETFFYDVLSGEYKPLEKPLFASVQTARKIADPAKRLQCLVECTDRAAEFAWRNLRDTLIYSFKHAHEIADDIANIDNAMKWGFSWELGPFEMFDAIGVKRFVERARKDGVALPDGLSSIETFYREEDGVNRTFSLGEGTYRHTPEAAGQISLSILRKRGGVVEKNHAASVVDLGDGVFCLEFHTKMNALEDATVAMLNSGLRRAEEEGIGLVVANEGSVFSAGANLAVMSEAIDTGSFDRIREMISFAQTSMLGMKYSAVPVVAAPHNMVLGGGCEVCLHADALNPHAETAMGLVESGVGLLPAGGGAKEMALRAIKRADEYELDVTPFIMKHFFQVAGARVSSSAAELYGMGFMRQGDAISMNSDRRIFDAKQKVISLAATYSAGKPETALKAPGRSIAATMKAQLWNMRLGGFISEYDEYLGGKIAEVMCGGDVPGGMHITEEYLLELELEAFLGLCGQQKTRERVQHMLRTGKPLRN